MTTEVAVQPTGQGRRLAEGRADPDGRGQSRRARRARRAQPLAGYRQAHRDVRPAPRRTRRRTRLGNGACRNHADLRRLAGALRGDARRAGRRALRAARRRGRGAARRFERSGRDGPRRRRGRARSDRRRPVDLGALGRRILCARARSLSPQARRRLRAAAGARGRGTRPSRRSPKSARNAEVRTAALVRIVGSKALRRPRRTTACACSNCAARRNRVASSPQRPTNCMPIGSPASFQCSGRDIAGWPVTLNSGV